VLELRKVDGQWQAWDGERLLASAPVVVLAGAAEVRASACAGCRSSAFAGRSPACRPPRQPGAARWCAPKAMWRRRVGEHTLGASFDFHSDTTPTTPSTRATWRCWTRFPPTWPSAGRGRAGCRAAARRAAFRCTSPDYLPIVGPVADTEAFAEAYAALARDARQVPDIACPWLGGCM
jgi:tRNA 5-methylaminomethyl-2-thiouridine biosynthesis bifunctional protein